jgi:type II secretory pathway predicted ATPase ExeA
MVPNYFNLVEEPFGVTPDPRFLYLGKQHREAMASLAYGTHTNQGFLALIAKPGMGKTSLLYQCLESLRGKARTAFVFRTDCNARELIRHILLDLGIDASSSDLPGMHDRLNQILIEEMNHGRRFVLVIDEAQNLDEQTLESIRLLSNFETPWKKLMQIVIAGQPGLAEKLTRPSLIQLRQRISMVMRIQPLEHDEICAYINHRLWIAGCKNPGLFTAGAIASIAKYSEGVPRRINNICFNAMSIACALKQRTIERATVLEAVADLDLEPLIETLSAVPLVPKEEPIQFISAPRRLTKKAGRQLQSWVPRLSVAGLLVLAAVTGVNNSEVRAANSVDSVNNAAAAQMPPVQTPTNPQVKNSSIDQGPRSVRISRRQTLSQLCVRTLGRYDPQVLAEIRDLNPGLGNPDDIRAGQRILMPSATRPPADDQDPASSRPGSLPEKVGKE